MTDKIITLRAELRRVAVIEAFNTGVAPGADAWQPKTASRKARARYASVKLPSVFGCTRSLAGDVVGYLAALLEGRKRRRRARRTERALMELDDHLLRDIGLRRSDIRAAAHSQPQGEASLQDPIVEPVKYRGGDRARDSQDQSPVGGTLSCAARFDNFRCDL